MTFLLNILSIGNVVLTLRYYVCVCVYATRDYSDGSWRFASGCRIDALYMHDERVPRRKRGRVHGSAYVLHADTPPSGRRSQSARAPRDASFRPLRHARDARLHRQPDAVAMRKQTAADGRHRQSGRGLAAAALLPRWLVQQGHAAHAAADGDAREPHDDVTAEYVIDGRGGDALPRQRRRKQRTWCVVLKVKRKAKCT